MNQSIHPSIHHLFLTWCPYNHKTPLLLVLSQNKVASLYTPHVALTIRKSTLIQYYYLIHRLHLNFKLSQQYLFCSFWSRILSRTHGAFSCHISETLVFHSFLSFTFILWYVAMVWMFVSLPPNSYVDTKSPVWGYLEVRALGKWLGDEGRALMDGLTPS
jgi:hypothetical protein